ncbi:MAG: protein kinase [Bacteroidota bacterium]
MDDLIGKKIENYVFLSILGKGGMGTVYLANDEKLNRKVAIKVLNTSNLLNRTHLIARFRTEAQNHAQLLHQNIVTVYGFIEFNNQFALVMEYVDGESLDRVIERNKHLHIYDVVYIVKQLLEGINFAHHKGYIHRDIKPSNIIVNSDGIVKIMDFGISKSLFEEEPRTKTGSRIGTIYYMSPEQIKGGNVTCQSDIYGIGCSLYEMISGFPPFFSHNEYDVMDGHLHKQFVPVDDFSPDLSVEINRILDKLLQKEAENRYHSCMEVQHDLSNLDKYIEKSGTDYFVHQKKKKILSKKKSLFIFSLMIITFMALIVFVFFEVKEFMNYKGYTIFEDGKISQNLDVIFDSSFSFSPMINVGTNRSLNAGIIKNGFDLYIVGDSALILRYDLILGSFEYLNTNLFSDIKNILEFANDGFIAIGEHSSIIKSGESNTITNVSLLAEHNSLYGIDFFNDNTGIIVGTEGVVLRSTNKGSKWERVESFDNNNLFDIKTINENIGFIVGNNGTIFKSSDKGLHWEKINVETEKYLKDISFSGDEVGIIVGGGGTIIRTEDGGENWIVINSGTDKALNSVKLINKKIFLAVGNLGTVLSSYDFGKTWKMIESKYYNNWNDILVNSRNNKVFLIGDNGAFVELLKGDN